MNRRDFLRSLFAVAIALPVAPILATAYSSQIIRVWLGDKLSLAEAIEMARPGDTIFLEPGTHKHQGTIRLRRVNLIGEHYSTTKIVINDADQYLIWSERGNVSNISVSGNFKS